MKISALLGILAVLMISSPAFSASHPDANTQEVMVGIYVLNIGKFDVSSGSYTVDFYLSMRCETACEPDKFEFMNGRAISLDRLIDKPNEKFYRIQAALSQNIDLRSYPFDRHKLSIEVEDKLKAKERLVYAPDAENSGVDPLVTIVGWELAGWDAEVIDHNYAEYGETFSRFIFNINIERITLSAILKLFLPVFFIVFVGLLALLLGIDKLPQRLGVNTSTLLAAVFFHINSTSSIPPVGYLTFADKFMIITYIVLITALFSTIMLMRHTEKKEEEKAKRMNRIAMLAVPAITLLLYIAIFAIGI
ncbi:MAG: hypothetical protein HYW25_06230 [Candidatus Aenigmarchaeota archaeon]|nr:hypothetical protein [Candidatus Aenigmarchaeota archaeon]